VRRDPRGPLVGDRPGAVRTRGRLLAATAVALVLVALAGACVDRAPPEAADARALHAQVVALPAPDAGGSVPLEEAIRRRRSTRSFAPRSLPLAVVGQLLWAAQGTTDREGRRAAPSAGATYPLELYVATAAEVVHYLPDGHRAELRPDLDHRGELAAAAFDQQFVGDAPAVVVVAAVRQRTRDRYGARGDAFVDREAGHATQNLLLEATALGLDAVPVGGLDPGRVRRALALPGEEDVLYLVPVGYPAGGGGEGS
jgi:SagB-type dehydrogenase family enzyme